MTALEYMQKQAKKCRINLENANKSGVPEEQINNIKKKISYYEAAVDALKKK